MESSGGVLTECVRTWDKRDILGCRSHGELPGGSGQCCVDSHFGVSHGKSIPSRDNK